MTGTLKQIPPWEISGCNWELWIAPIGPNTEFVYRDTLNTRAEAIEAAAEYLADNYNCKITAVAIDPETDR